MIADIIQSGPALAEDLQSYVDSFKASSDRARYALYIMIIATVLVASVNYSFQSWSWPIRRINAWYGDTAKVPRGTPEDQVRIEKDRQAARLFFGGDVERLKLAREEYLKQFTGRLVFNASPIPGVSIDCNDLGVLGGIALVLLALVLTLSINREHENLYLALYKVRRLSSIPGEDHSRGDSRANLLYHALAMSQALSSPPTLARWENRGILHHFGWILFLPTVVYGWVLRTNLETVEKGNAYGADMRRILIVQVVFAAILLFLNGTAFLHSHAMARRWKRAFFRINPGRRYVRQMNSWEWLGLPVRGRSEQLRRLVTELIDTLDGLDPSVIGSVVVETSKTIGERGVVNSDVKAMAEDLVQAGISESKSWCQDRGVFQRLLSFRAHDNVVSGQKWNVRGTWTFGYAPVVPAGSRQPAANRTQ